MHRFQCHNYGIYELVRELRKNVCLYVGITFFLFVCFLDFSLFHKKTANKGKKKKQIKCCGDVPKPSWKQVL